MFSVVYVNRFSLSFTVFKINGGQWGMFMGIEMRCGCSVVISLSTRSSTISLNKETNRTLGPSLMKFGVKLACDMQMMCLFRRLILSVGPCQKMGSKGWKWYFHIFLYGAFILHPILLRFFFFGFLTKMSFTNIQTD